MSFLVIGGAPVFPYRHANAKKGTPALRAIFRGPIALDCRGHHRDRVGARVINPDIAATPIGAALLAVLLLPTIAGVILQGLPGSIFNLRLPEPTRRLRR